MGLSPKQKKKGRKRRFGASLTEKKKKKKNQWAPCNRILWNWCWLGFLVSTIQSHPCMETTSKTRFPSSSDVFAIVLQILIH
jgi:hypothetical protein